MRNVDQTGDYTNYARGVYADYYQCYGPTSYNPGPVLSPTCYSPSAVWHAVEQNKHFQNELRFSTPDEWRLRGILGAFWEDNKLYDQTAWMYKELPPCTTNESPGTGGNRGCLSNVGTIPGTTVVNPGVQGDHVGFYQDQVREVKQLAFFTSVDLDLIPKTLTITAGARWFRFDNSMKGSALSSFGCFQGGLNGALVPGTTNGCYVANYPNPYPAPAFGSTYYSYNLDHDNLSDTETGTRSRANLTWHVAPDVMLYYTFSQGFRPGGFNQNGGAPHAYISLTPGSGAPPNAAQYFTPRSFTSDDLTNNEIGWKTQFFNHRLLWNGAIYKENWNNVQIEFFNPGVVGDLFYNTNGQNFEIKGVETQLVAQITDGFTLQGAAAWNSSEQTNSPSLFVNNPAAPGYGTPITNACNLFLAQLRESLESVRNGRFSERQCTTGAVQRARPLPVAHQWLRSIHSGRSFSYCAFLHTGGCESDLPPGRNREHLERAVREPGLHDLRRSNRGLEGCLAFRTHLREPDRLERQHFHQLTAIHHRADAAQA